MREHGEYTRDRVNIWDNMVNIWKIWWISGKKRGKYMRKHGEYMKKTGWI